MPSLRVELNQELPTTNRFRLFADDSCVDCQPVETRQESPVGFVSPTYETGTAPTAGAQMVQTPVISDTEWHVRLDSRRTRTPKRSPNMEAVRMPRSQGQESVMTKRRIASFHLCEFVADRRVIGRKNRFGRTATRHADRLVAHMRSLRS